MIILEEQCYGDLNSRVKHRMVKYLNNIVEQDHRHIKRITNNMLGFKSFEPACSTIVSVKVIHMIQKGHANIKSVADEIQFINQLFNVA